MKVACGWDHHGRKFKPVLQKILEGAGHELIDLGAQSDESTDYPDFAFAVAEAVTSGRAQRGILICGTGVGMCMAANKVLGIRAGLVADETVARLSREHNDTNVLCLGELTARNESLLGKIIGIWLTTEFARGGRHERRVDKIIQYEKAHCSGT